MVYMENDIFTQIWNLINSNFFMSIVMIIVGLIAFVIIKYNEFNYKRKAALILIFEIREIEKSISQLKSIQNINDFYVSEPVIIENNWNKLKIYFVNELDQDQYTQITDFYSVAQKIEDERKILRNQLIIAFDSKATYIQSVIANYSKDNNNMNNTEFKSNIEKMTKRIFEEGTCFTPDVPKNLINHLLKDITFITISTSGSKLKDISQSKFLFIL